MTQDLEAARTIYESWQQLYTRDPVPPVNLGRIYVVLGEYGKALIAVQEGLRVDPGSGLGYANLVSGYLHLNRLEEAKASASEARTHHLDSLRIHLSLYSINFVEHDAAGMDREAALLIDNPGFESVILYNESKTASYAGQFVKARKLMDRAVQSAVRADHKEAAAGYEAEAAIREALAGNTRLAKQQAEAALELSNGRDAEGIAAIALAIAGDSNRASQLSKDLSERFPNDTMVQSQYLPMIRAAIISSDDHPQPIDQVINALAAAAPHELGYPAPVLGFALYPVYLRGEAYLKSDQADAAAAEFQKIVDHPGVVQNDLIGALALLQLGRSLARSGNEHKAAPLYQDFLTLYKDADSDLRIVQEAKAEFTNLKGNR